MTSVATDDRSVEALRGRATGVLFLSGFGALWFLLGLAGHLARSFRQLREVGVAGV